MKVFVPTYDSNNCVVIQNNNTVRVYDSQPRLNADINYKDYYIHSDYYFVNGTQHFNQYSTLPTCISSSDITTEYSYRVDFPFIMLTALAMIFVGFFLVRNLVRTLFVDWRYC